MRHFCSGSGNWRWTNRCSFEIDGFHVFVFVTLFVQRPSVVAVQSFMIQRCFESLSVCSGGNQTIYCFNSQSLWSFRSSDMCTSELYFRIHLLISLVGSKAHCLCQDSVLFLLQAERLSHPAVLVVVVVGSTGTPPPNPTQFGNYHPPTNYIHVLVVAARP